MEFRAARDIKEGEEFCISYMDGTVPFSERQKYLEDNYDFTCKCESCAHASESSIEVSDERRSRIRAECLAAAGMWMRWFEGDPPETTKLIDNFKRLLADIEEERLEAYRPIPIRWLAYTYAAMGDEETFRWWCEEAIGCIGILSVKGKGFCDNDIWKGWQKNPSSVPFWGMKQSNK